MSRFEGPQGIVTNGLVLNLDAGDPDSYTRSQPPYVEVLVVAGGGSGGTSSPANGGGGGGGAGGVIYNSAYQLSNAAAVTVTVGAGGAGQTSDTSQGNDGSNSVFGSLTAVGGGGGGSASGGTTTGRNGGSGGGAGYAGYYNNFNSGTGTAGQGFRGGYVLANNNAGGGGGAGGVGGDTFDSRPEPGYPAGNGGLGGPGVYYSISGTSTLYSTGGNGGANDPNTIVSGSGTTGTYASGDTTTAAPGIVIVRYPGLPAATGGTITYLNGYTIHTFTSSGTFTPYLWNDLSGGGRNGTLVNGVGFNSYKNGGYLVFDGTDDYINNINNSGMLSNGTGGFSYFAWVNLQGKPTFGTIFENGLYTDGMLIRYQTNGIDIYAQGGFIGKFTFDPTLDTWNHLSFVRNGNFLDFYINGVYQSAFGFSLSMTYASNLFIGTSQHATTQCFNGYIPVAQIYNRTLSTTEITQNFNAQRNRFGV
jgi:hypothetical protein